MSSLKCVQSACNQPRHPGKAYCLEHYKQLDNFAYGMDAEIQSKLAAKFSPEKAAQAQAWIEALTGTRFPASFQESLKSGVLLCQAINRIKPGSVPNINAQNSPFKHRENIENFVKAEKVLGMKEVDLFVTADLYEGNNIVAVIDNIFALGSVAQKVPGFHGPYIGVKHSDENPRDFSADVLAAGKAAPTRQTVGSYGFQDESRNPIIARQIIRDVSGHQASDLPSMQNAGAIAHEKGSRIDQIIKNPDEFMANRGGAGGPVSGGASGGGFCGSCGTARVGAAKFCGNCGKSF